MKTVYLDTETTGLDPDQDELVEIAIVDDRGDTLVNKLLRRQFHRGWPEAERIHGIAPQAVEAAPSLPEVLPEIAAAVTGARVVIYNAAFDVGFLPEVAGAAAEVRCCMVAFAAEYGEHDDYHGDYRWQTLASAARYVDRQWQGGAHRALGDALACRDVWRYLTGSTAYRGEVDARRLEAARLADAAREIERALDRYENRVNAARVERWWAAQRAAERVIQRYFLRQTGPRHWLSSLPGD